MPSRIDLTGLAAHYDRQHPSEHLMTDRGRRAFPREPFQDAVYTYENGRRFDANPRDIGLGGAFLYSTSSERIAKGEVVGIAFDEEAGFAPPVFLFGRVIRKQGAPKPGIGLKWIRAVTSGDPDYLAHFLDARFGIHREVALEKIVTSEGRNRTVFPFEPLHVVGATLHHTYSKDKDAPKEDEPAERPRQDLLDELNQALKLAVPGGDAATPGSKGPRRPAAPRMDEPFDDLPGPARQEGTLTQQVTRQGLRASCVMSGAIEMASAWVDCSILSLGVTHLYVQTPVRPISPQVDPRVHVDIPTRDGAIHVTMSCRIVETRADPLPENCGLELAILAMDEAGHAGIVARYVKWLHFSSLTE
jgi:hypothetical protein